MIIGTIELTPAENAILARIKFDLSSVHDHILVRENGKSVAELMVFSC